MEEIQQPILTLNDKTYVIEDLSDKAKYIISHLTDLKEQEKGLKFKFDQIEIAVTGFTNLLQEELADTEEKGAE